MPDLIQELFTASTAPAGSTVDVTGDGTVVFSGGVVTLSAGVAGTARLRLATANMSADDDTVRVKVDSTSSFNAAVILRQATGSGDFQAAFDVNPSNWVPARWRDSTGASPLTSSTLFTKTSPQWLQFRRVSATSLALESAPDVAGVPGTFVLRSTTAGSDSLVFSMSTTTIELFISTGGSIVIDRVGSGAGGASICALRRRRAA